MTTAAPTGALLGYARVRITRQVLNQQLDALRHAGVADARVWTEKMSGKRRSQLVLEELAEHVRRFPSSHPDRLVFTDDDDNGLRRTAFSRVWRPIVAAAGAPAGTGFHDLRHYFASLLIR